MTTDPWISHEAGKSPIDNLLQNALDAYVANPMLVREHAEHEDYIRTSGYSDRTILELLQNAADALKGTAGTDDPRHIQIVLDKTTNTLYVANSGHPFTAEGVKALTHAHISDKRGEEIGRFGLGFKSVLAVTEKPAVFSRSMSFYFDRVEASKAIRERLPDVRGAVPVLRTPFPIDVAEEFQSDPVLAKLSETASTVIRLPKVINSIDLEKKLREFDAHMLLFTPDVRSIETRILGHGSWSTYHGLIHTGGDDYILESGDEEEPWRVLHSRYRPDFKDREQVGKAVAREEVTISVAIPLDLRQQFRGQLWSYFPLNDATTTRAIFNAPWSVNADRTTLQQNQYNAKMLTEAAKLFVELLPSLSNDLDPGRHFDYLPGRLSDSRGYGDDILTDRINDFTAQSAVVPDATGALTLPGDLRPLWLTLDRPVEEKVHRSWQSSPHTGDDVPHWTVYSRERAAKLRIIFERSAGAGSLVTSNYERVRSLRDIPGRSPIRFLAELAQGPHLPSTSYALALNLKHPELARHRKAPVIPTTHGYKSLEENASIFLSNPSRIESPGASFVDENFLAIPKARELLQRAGIGELDAEAILRATLVATRQAIPQGDEDALNDRWSDIWKAIKNVRYSDVLSILERAALHILVPTVSGEWRDPEQVIYVDAMLPAQLQKFQLDVSIAPAEVALKLGVLHRGLSENYDYTLEWFQSEYLEHARKEAEAQIGKKLFQGEGKLSSQGKYWGPYSLLPFLKKSGASEQQVAEATKELIRKNSLDKWEFQIYSQRDPVEVTSPIEWAIRNFGLLPTTAGMQNPFEVASPEIRPFDVLLPTLAPTDGDIARKLGAPGRIGDVPPHALAAALDQKPFPPLSHSISPDDLNTFILDACVRAFDEQMPYSIPAWEGNRLVASIPSNVYVARDETEVEALKNSGKRYLFTQDVATTERLISEVGCQDFNNHFSFSLITLDVEEPELVLDTFASLRRSYSARRLEGVMTRRASQVIKRINSPDGTEDRHLDHIFEEEERTLYVTPEIGDTDVLHILNDELALEFSEPDIHAIQEARVAEGLQHMRLEARNKQTDAEKLNCYFDDKVLKGALPSGLWRSLESQGLVNKESSVAELLISVEGRATIQRLRTQFEDLGFAPPHKWMNNRTTIDWLSEMGFGTEYAPRPSQAREPWFTVPGRVILNELHDYQKDIQADLTHRILTRDDKGRATKQIVELPTGAGKTRVAVQTVVEMFRDDKLAGPVLWIAQTQELCEQAVLTWSEIWSGFDDPRPMTIGRLWENNSVPEPETELSVVVATDHKLNNVFDSDEYDWLKESSLVIIDEAHRAGSSPMYTKILNHLGIDGRSWKRPLVGLTATPFRGTSESETTKLLNRFGGGETIKPFGDENAYRQLTEMEILAKVKHEIIQGSQINISRAVRDNIVKQRLVPSSVLENLGQDGSRNADLVRHILSHDSSWPILVFTPSILSAQILAATLRYQGKTAASIDSNTPNSERNRIINDFKRHGEKPAKDTIQILVNCDVLTQGFDAPAVRALYIAKPTFSPNRYIQMVGRGLRGPLNGGKETCLIVDIQDNFGGDQELNNEMAFFEYRELWQSAN